MRTTSHKKKSGLVIAFLAIVCVLGFIALCCTIFFGAYGALFAGNFWFTEHTLLRAVWRANPAITKVVDFDRKIWAFTTVVAEDMYGNRFEYYIDTNIAFDAKATIKD